MIEGTWTECHLRLGNMNPPKFRSRTAGDAIALDASRQCFVPSTPTCLIVEDEAIIALSLETEFQEAGYATAGPFATCALALASLDTDCPDAAVLDTVLKDGSCIALARELIRRSIPFVIYSGADERQASAPEFAGVTWIVKPSPQAAVVAAVAQLLHRNPAQEGNAD